LNRIKKVSVSQLKITFLSIIAIACLWVVGCCDRTIEPVIPEGERIVLLEEFTGKGCTNCPKGSREIDNLLSFYNGQLVVVSIHANFFANPAQFPLGQFDLRTDEGEQLFNYLGPNLGYPAGVINRRKFSNEFQHGANVWAGFVAQESLIDPDVEFAINRTYDESSRQVDLQVQGRAKVAISAPLRISVMFTESGIIDAQDDAEAHDIVPDYMHNHVLRDMLTPFDGQDLAQGLEAGEEFEATFSYTVSSDWNAANCNIIVFVSRNTSAGDIYVLQAGEVHLID
jgi:thiol-disulfide isomerase/thioredoxin